MIRLSIILPFFNVEEYISDCLESLFKQDIPECEYEIICVDDCSQDSSLSIVQCFQKVHSNIRIVTCPENRKVGGARNAGLANARGTYVWFVDSDDVLKENVLKELLSIAEEGEYDFLHFSHSNLINGEEQRLEESIVEDSDDMEGIELFIDHRFVWYEDFIVAWNKIYKRSFLASENIRFVENVMYEDNDFSIQSFRCAKHVKHIKRICYCYRNNPSSFTRTAVTEFHFKCKLLLCKRLEVILKSIEPSDELYEVIDKFISSEVSLMISNSVVCLTWREKMRYFFLSINLLRCFSGYISLRQAVKLFGKFVPA